MVCDEYAAQAADRGAAMGGHRTAGVGPPGADAGPWPWFGCSRPRRTRRFFRPHRRRRSRRRRRRSPSWTDAPEVDARCPRSVREPARAHALSRTCPDPALFASRLAAAARELRPIARPARTLPLRTADVQKHLADIPAATWNVRPCVWNIQGHSATAPVRLRAFPSGFRTIPSRLGAIPPAPRSIPIELAVFPYASGMIPSKVESIPVLKGMCLFKLGNIQIWV